MTKIYSFRPPWFRRVLEFAGWDPNTLADWAEVPRETVASWLSGADQPEEADFDRVAEVLALSHCHSCGGLGYVDMSDARTIKLLARSAPSRDIAHATKAALNESFTPPRPKNTKPAALPKSTRHPPRIVSVGSHSVSARRVGDLWIDMHTGVVSIGHNGVEMFEREMRLLCLLADAGGEWVSRETLGQLWPEAADPGHNARTLVSIVKHKLSTLGVENYIEGRSARGYRLASPEMDEEMSA